MRSQRQDPPPRQAPPIPVREPRRGRKGGTSAVKVALGVVLGLFLFVGACVAIIGSGVKDATEKKTATVRIEAAADVCWQGFIGDATRDGCGPASFDVQTSFGSVASANVQKQADDGKELAIVLTVEGKEYRASTSAAYGVAQVTSEA